MQQVTKFFVRLSSPPGFYQASSTVLPWLLVATCLCIGIAMVDGLFFAPEDYQQGDGYRIIFVHVPAAWMSLLAYLIMACAGATALIWRVKIAEILAMAAAPIGATFTLLALVTGSIWGKPMWGTWWVWDARLTSELILLFLYLGVIALYASHPDRRIGARLASILALIGLVNIPIIHFSVEWWNTLHQGATVSRLGAPRIHLRMLYPLLLMALGYALLFFSTWLLLARTEILSRERNSAWVDRLLQTR